MFIEGAPKSYLVLNLAALVVTIFTVFLLKSLRDTSSKLVLAFIVIILGLSLIIGPDLNGVRRWISLGPLNLHLGMLLLPALCVITARCSPKTQFFSFLLTGMILVLQPDRGTAMGILAATIMFALLKSQTWTWLTVVISSLVLAITVYLPDPLEGVIFVENVIETAFSVLPAMGTAIVLSLVAAGLVPMIWASQGDVSSRIEVTIFSAFFWGLILASLLGQYPTPLVGYGASPIIGYGLGIALLTRNPEGRSDGS